jgi:small ligand-binding sensory domain FIST
MKTLAGVVGGLGEHDQKLARHSLSLGIAMDRLNESPRMGDFLIRNIVGVDQSRGYLAIGETPSEGQIVQFHLRDAQTSTEDLDALLSRYAIEHPIYEETGALLFSCLGRGQHLFGRADHDTDMFREKVNAMPLAGFFCNGEIGPVGGTTFLHGYTSSFGIFRTRQPE